MRYAPSIATKISLRESSPSLLRTTKTILVTIVDALHHSRRLQAERVLLRYRDLIDQAKHSIVSELNASSGAHQHVDGK